MARLPTLVVVLLAGALAFGREPIPDRLVVLTFDDASKSHFTVVRPLLLKHKFGATFFVTEGWDFATNKKDYMSWDEIKQLHADGFEIGNHTIDHMSVTDKTVRDLAAQVKAINARCETHGIPRPVSFAYPGNAIVKEALPVLKELGIVFARRGGAPEHPYKEGRGFAYEPGLDHPLLVPTAGDARPTWALDDLKAAVAQAKHGRIAVLQFHGVPDTAHSWVNTSKEQFEAFVKYLADEKFTVIALRDLAKYVDPDVVPSDPFGGIEDRNAGWRPGNRREWPAGPNEDDLRYWLDNALRHRSRRPRPGRLAMTADEVTAAAKRLGIDPRSHDGSPRTATMLRTRRSAPADRVRDVAIRPQRGRGERVRPGPDGGYAVADVPRPSGRADAEETRTAVLPTPTSRPPGTAANHLDPLEWTEPDAPDAGRTLPNKVTLATTIKPA